MIIQKNLITATRIIGWSWKNINAKIQGEGIKNIITKINTSKITNSEASEIR